MSPRRRAWLALLLLPMLAAAGFLGRGRLVGEFRRVRLLAEVPELDRDLAAHLCRDSDAGWIEYSRRGGVVPLGDAVRTLRVGLHVDSYPVFLRRRGLLQWAEVRVGRGLAGAFGLVASERHSRLCQAMPPERDFEAIGLERAYVRALTDTSLRAPERLLELERIRSGLLALGDEHRAVLLEFAGARCELERGDAVRYRQRLAGALENARRLEEVNMVCQGLGEMGVLHASQGHLDSMSTCYREGIALATRHGMLDQVARFAKFEAANEAEAGRLALALERLGEVQRLFEEQGAGSSRLRMQIDYAAVLAKLRCWDLVERSLRRMPPLVRAQSWSGRAVETRKLEFDVALLRARLAFARGNAGQADSVLRPWLDSMVPGYARIGYAELFDIWSQGLAEAGRNAEALALCERGRIHCDSAHVPERGQPLLLRRARLLEALGRVGDAGRSLDELDERLADSPGENERLEMASALLRARLQVRLGRREAARTAVRRIFADYVERRRSEGGALVDERESSDAQYLLGTIHAVEAFTPREGYAFEMDWRSLAAEMGGGRSGVPRAAAGRPSATRLAAGKLTGTHLVYRFDGDVLLRWTRTGRRVDLDTLRFSAREAVLEVRQALALVQSEAVPAGRVLGPGARARLARLAARILPATLGARLGKAGLLRISADGPLLALPFELLPAPGPGGEEPLASWADVEYVRGHAGAPSRPTAPPAIVANPSLPDRVRRQYHLPTSLGGSESDVRDARARWPGARVLRGEEATKPAVLASWIGAPVIYVATHHVLDADAPVPGFIPLANPTPDDPEAGLLEIADVHALDLSACRLAVLAACASGAPYRLTAQPGIGLADAFLDSGARSIVRSFWGVGDEEAHAFMGRLLAEWREAGDDGRALGRARRGIMASPDGRSPRIWAAWSVAVTLPRTERSSFFAETLDRPRRAPVAAAR